jgi:hypothetical protein
MIQELSVQFSVKDCCVALRVSRSGYNRWLGREQSAGAQRNRELLKEIRRVYGEHRGRYGSPRITQRFPNDQVFSSRVQARRAIFELH